MNALDDDDRARLHELAARAAENGTPLRTLVEAHLRVDDHDIAHPALPGTAPIPAHVLRLVRDTTIALTEGYESGHRAAIRHEEEMRHVFLDGLLRGTEDLGRQAERAHSIGFQLTGPHRVAVARAEAPFAATDAATRYVEEAMTSCRSKGRSACLVAARDELLVCVSAGSDADICERFGRRVHGSAASHPQVAISRPRPGASGVALAYREARETLDIAARLAMPAPVIHASELLVFQVLGRDRAAITDLVATVLGGLEQARGGAGTLLRTLSAYFESSCAHTVTARRLGLSVRAVAYRMARVRTLTGYDPAVPDQRYALQTAVLGARLLNWPAHPLQPPD
ncbi:PucR family transcriptional regulator [Streptomyces sp. NPDC051684]|uniref:PucR family transcriptional regulator n=1 Tax=Streptomyces sp. NPDC051684 TaxID=3365670 RepID=UPI0037AEEF88